MRNFKKVIFGGSLILFLSMSNIALAATGTVTGKTVRIREAADANSKILTNAYRQDIVNVLSEEGDWYKVEFESQTGYISKEFVEVKGEISKEDVTPTATQPVEENKEPETAVLENRKMLKDSSIKILPNFSSRDLGVISLGTEVEIQREFNNWVQITAGINKGWVLKSSIEGYNVTNTVSPEQPVETPEEKTELTETPESAPEENINKVGYINIDTARIRETAGGKIIGNLDEDDEVTILGEEGNWYKITCKDFSEGYVSKDLITIGKVSSRSLDGNREEENVEPSQLEAPVPEPEPVAEPEPTPEPAPEPVPVSSSNLGDEIVAFANSFLGCRYVSGGTSPSGFDCSGFTQYVYSNFGYSLARVTGGQAQNGVEVSRDGLQPGDVLVFLDSGCSCIGHVGIYIGDGNFVHAANPSRGVVIDNLNSNSYYNQRFVCGRRII